MLFECTAETLPCNIVFNPKEHINVIPLKSGRELGWQQRIMVEPYNEAPHIAWPNHSMEEPSGKMAEYTKSKPKQIRVSNSKKI